MNEVMGKLFIFQKSMKDMRKREVGDGIKNSNLTFEENGFIGSPGGCFKSQKFET